MRRRNGLHPVLLKEPSQLRLLRERHHENSMALLGQKPELPVDDGADPLWHHRGLVVVAAALGEEPGDLLDRELLPRRREVADDVEDLGGRELAVVAAGERPEILPGRRVVDHAHERGEDLGQAQLDGPIHNGGQVAWLAEVPEAEEEKPVAEPKRLLLEGYGKVKGDVRAEG